LSKRAWGARLDERGLASRKGAKGARERLGIRLGGASQVAQAYAPPSAERSESPSPTGRWREAHRGAESGIFPYDALIGDFPETAPQAPPSVLAPPSTVQRDREPGEDDEDVAGP